MYFDFAEQEKVEDLQAKIEKQDAMFAQGQVGFAISLYEGLHILTICLILLFSRDCGSGFTASPQNKFQL